MTVSEKAEAYGREVEAKLRATGFRVSGDYRPEKIGAKVREASLEKVPYMLVAGERDAAAGTVALRDRAEGKDVGTFLVAEVVARLRAEVEAKTVRSVSTATANLEGGPTRFAG
jgi:threonyl-tRNA synthetase